MEVSNTLIVLCSQAVSSGSGLRVHYAMFIAIWRLNARLLTLLILPFVINYSRLDFIWIALMLVAL